MMRALLAVPVALFFITASTNSQAAEANCHWQAKHTAHNFSAGSQYNSFTACSIFIRGLILGSSNETLGNFGQLAVGTETEGTVTFVESNGSKRVCETQPRKSDADRLDRFEYLASYLYAELTGADLPSAEKDKAAQMLRNTKVTPEEVVRKINDSLVLVCHDSVS